MSCTIITQSAIETLRWSSHIARMEEDRSSFETLTGKSTGKRPLGTRSWEENIKMDLKEIGINVRNWVDSSQDRDYWGALGDVRH